jgi:UDP-N-acetyl-D-mannosaminuronate dehydrogenase
MLGGLRGKRIAIFGVSYRQDVGDTRYSPTETFVRAMIQREAIIYVHDPLVVLWEEMAMELDAELPTAAIIDAVVFAVPHREYCEMDLVAWAGGATPAVLDANNVLSSKQRAALRAAGCRVESIGMGAEK